MVYPEGLFYGSIIYIKQLINFPQISVRYSILVSNALWASKVRRIFNEKPEQIDGNVLIVFLIICYNSITFFCPILSLFNNKMPKYLPVEVRHRYMMSRSPGFLSGRSFY